MRFEPAPPVSSCVALLDDRSGGKDARSRLYLGHVGTLTLSEATSLDMLAQQVQALLVRGLHAVGLFKYELGTELQAVAASPERQPLAQVLIFEHCRIVAEEEVTDWLAEQAGSSDRAGIANVRASVTAREFEEAVARIKSYICAGDTYQVNYTFRFDFDAYGSPAALYARLRERQRVPFGAFIALPDGGAVLSLSPELFVRHSAGTLTAQPMKGTARAGADEAENQRNAASLAADVKNRAENVMIVDLLRSDLGRIARTGTVRVSSLFDVDRFGDVLQMTSTVCAELQEDRTLADILRAIFPCGSITGAPKRRSMQIIQELEPTPRGTYTGGIAWFQTPSTPDRIGDFCMSVPIRTLVLEPPRDGVRAGQMGVGAGIVADSEASKELAECQLKAAFLTGLANDFELFETMYANRRDGCRHLLRHLTRLATSASYFGFKFDSVAAATAVRGLCAELDPQREYRLRLALRQDGNLSLKHTVQARLAEPVRVFVAEDSLDVDDLFLRHKSSVRARLDAAWRDAEARGGFDTLFFNERGELAQGGRSNVFLRLDGRWFTPPLTSGALPGVMRAVLLEDPAWAAAERVLTRRDLERCSEIVLCNALRGPLMASLVERASTPMGLRRG